MKDEILKCEHCGSSNMAAGPNNSVNHVINAICNDCGKETKFNLLSNGWKTARLLIRLATMKPNLQRKASLTYF